MYQFDAPSNRQEKILTLFGNFLYGPEIAISNFMFLRHISLSIALKGGAELVSVTIMFVALSCLSAVRTLVIAKLETWGHCKACTKKGKASVTGRALLLFLDSAMIPLNSANVLLHPAIVRLVEQCRLVKQLSQKPGLAFSSTSQQ